MDFGSFLNDTWKNIGNFFGVNQKKKQDDNPPPQPTFQRPSGPVSLNLPQNNNSILNTPSTLQAPKSFIPGQDQNNNPLVLGGVKQSQQPQPQPQAVQQAHDMIANHGTGAPFSPDVIKAAQNNANLPPNPSNFNPANLKPKDPWWLKAAHGFIGAENDAGGLVGTALGSVLPFGDSNIYSQKGRDNLAKDFQNETYNPNTGQWFKTGTDFANKAQSDINRGDVEATLGDMGTTVLNAASLIPAEGLAVGGVNAARTAAEQGGKQLFKDAAKGGIVPGIFGLGMGASQAAQNDASPLDILKSSLEGGATGYALGSLVPVAGNAAGRFRNRISNRAVQDGTDLVDEQLGNDAGRTITEEPVTQQPETPATPQTPRDPSSPITASPTTNKAPAITSPNRPATPPTVQPPRPLFPQAADNAGMPTAQPMIVQAPEAPSVNVNVPTADQATAAAQKAVEDTAAKPAPAPAETQVAPVETPEAVASKEAAAQAPPVSPEAIAAAEAQAAHQAPTEEIAQALSNADAKTNQILDMAKSTLGDDGYAKLVQKVAHNSEAGNIPEPLTAEEQAVLDAVKPHADAAVKKANDLRIANADLGRRQQYLPTKAQDSLTEVTDVPSALEHGLTFAEKRANGDAGLTHEQRGTGAEQALRDMMRTHELLDHAPKDQLNEIAARRMTNEVNSLIETDAKGVSTGLKLSEPDIQDIHAGNKYAIDAADHAQEIRKQADANPGDKSLQQEAKAAQHEADQAEFDQQKDVILKARKTAEARIQDINKSTLTGSQKAAARSQVKNALANIESKSHYIMSYTKSNILSTPLGRVADQVGKTVTASEDNTVGRLAKGVASHFYMKKTGEKLFADSKTTKDVYNLLKGDKSLQYFGRGIRMNKVLEVTGKDNPLAKLSGAYRTGMTALVESGSRYRAPLKNTISHFAAKAQAAGITDTNDVAAYVRSRANSAEWQRVYDTMYHDANSFTGVPTPRNAGGSGEAPVGKLSRNIQNVAGAVRSGVQDGVEKLPLPDSLKHNLVDSISINLAGFPKTMLNITGAALDRATLGAGSFIKAARMNPTTEAERMTQALLIKRGLTSATTAPVAGALGATLGAAGLVTGAYPTDPSEQKRWQAEHIQPYSVKIGDNWVDISRYAPQVAIPLQIGATLGTQKPGTTDLPKALTQIFGNTVTQVSQNFGLDQVGNILSTAGDALSGKESTKFPDQVAKFAAGVIDSFVPLSSAVNQVGNAKDTYQRDTSGNGIVDTIKNDLTKATTFNRQSLPTKNDVFGEPLLQNGTNAPNNAVESELHRLSQSGVEAYPQGVQGKNRDYQVKGTDGKDIALNADQQRSLNTAIGQDKEKQAALIMGSPEYQKANDQQKGDMLKKLYSMDNSAVASDWAAKNNVGNVKTTTEKVNNSLSTTDQQALVSYKLQGDKQKAWLDDNKNAANYYTASYDNAKANGTLTADDNDLQNKTGKRYLAVGAQVDQKFGADHNLREMYKKISETDFRKMLTPDNADYNPKLATQLYRYDQARTKAGVSGAKFSDKPKFNLDAKLYGTKGGRRGSGGGVSASDKFAFASLPSSLIGTGSRAGSGSQYAPDAPLFKPIPDLQPAVGAPIPKGRTISVKKGR